ncbi:uncharacterized protein si:dkeyp-55f12.3 [Osmerus eperlanus]|uniref:uncharacterized protein si:dkeyp-55f12.3 n=1 Tax=Osmerus eperlanus TaxID=29151 RepID=UPI002E10D165
MELRGELKYRDGRKKELLIKTENSLPSLIVGIKKLNAEVSVLLTELVVQEKLNGGSDDQGDFEADDDGENDSDDEEEDTKIVIKAPVSEPPAKRSKSLRT